MKYQEILDFWFSSETRSHWFHKSHQFDELLHQKFANLLLQAAQNELWKWRETAQGRLAEILVLDQFSRNIYRDSAQAFAQDPLALGLAQEAIRFNFDQHLNLEQRRFLYMPFMHSESKIIHVEALMLFQQLNDPTVLDYELQHKAIVDQFGRYPHRNIILGRESTADELAFLQQPNSSF